MPTACHSVHEGVAAFGPVSLAGRVSGRRSSLSAEDVGCAVLVIIACRIAWICFPSDDFVEKR
jgi:hypothetical protein